MGTGAKDSRGKRGGGCCAFWCHRRIGASDKVAVPGLFTGHASKSKAALAKKAKRNKVLTALLRGDVVHAEANVNFAPVARTRSEKSVLQPGADYRCCKVHLDGDGNVLPLDHDPVMSGAIDGLNSAAVGAAAANTVLGKARDKVAADYGSPSSSRADRRATRQMGHGGVSAAAPVGPR